MKITSIKMRMNNSGLILSYYTQHFDTIDHIHPVVAGDSHPFCLNLFHFFSYL